MEVVFVLAILSWIIFATHICQRVVASRAFPQTTAGLRLQLAVTDRTSFLLHEWSWERQVPRPATRWSAESRSSRMASRVVALAWKLRARMRDRSDTMHRLEHSRAPLR